MKLKTGRHTSALKAGRQAEKAASRNRGMKARIHAVSKEFSASSKTDSALAKKVLPKAMSVLDKAVRCGTIHWKSAARRKSKMAIMLNKVASSIAEK